ncbi:MAG: hypothetical protein K2Y02_10655, partial [Burkholderiaceae bacterium]|nr:hypothetical protein [Burkholderiaceae bacterium]
MKRFVVLDKKSGETPLAALAAWKAANPVYKDVPASYAGRLDPMARGKLLIVLGEECKKQVKYTGLDKEYEIEVLLDVGSDTGDALGIVAASPKDTRPDRRLIEQAVRAEVGKHVRAYPAYSSKTVNGKPLFLHALEGTLETIEIPTHEEELFSVHVLGVAQFSKDELASRVEDFLALAPTSDEPSKVLGADFRIKDVRASWEKVFVHSSRSYVVLKLRISCGTGTYMRSLAGRIGASLGTTALALSIH